MNIVKVYFLFLLFIDTQRKKVSEKKGILTLSEKMSKSIELRVMDLDFPLSPTVPPKKRITREIFFLVFNSSISFQEQKKAPVFSLNTRCAFSEIVALLH